MRHGSRITAKGLLENKTYRNLVEWHRDNEREYYVPSRREISELWRYGYPKSDPAYCRIEHFFEEELHEKKGQNHLCDYARRAILKGHRQVDLYGIQGRDALGNEDGPLDFSPWLIGNGPSPDLSQKNALYVGNAPFQSNGTTRAVLHSQNNGATRAVLHSRTMVRTRAVCPFQSNSSR